jgi:hypothetical protein
MCVRASSFADGHEATASNAQRNKAAAAAAKFSHMYK